MRLSLNRRGVGWFVVAAAVSAMAVWILWPRPAEPVYLGRTVRSYFSSWQPPGGGDWPPKQLDRLGDNLTPEAVPIVIDALNRTDSRAQIQMIRMRVGLPRWLQDRLPWPLPAAFVRTTAGTTLLRGMRHSNEARAINRAVASQFSRIPLEVRREAIRHLGDDPSAADAAEPILLAALRGTNAFERIMAADALLRLGAGPSHRMDALVAALTPIAGSARDFPNAWPGFCRELGRLGPAARPALPMLQRLAEDRLPEVRAEAALACWRIEPDGESAAEFLTRELGRLGSRGAFILVAAWSSEQSALKVPAADAVPLLARLIELGTKAARQPGVRPATEAVLYIVDDHYTERRFEYPPGLPDVRIRELACDLAAGYGPAARDLAPQLREASKQSDPDVRDAARRALLKIRTDDVTGDH
jgi:hypothetical protein